jgi:glyoxylate/hydroxypyruvate reductase A
MLHLHIENQRGKATVFHMTPELYAAAAARHPELAGSLRVTFGWDGEDLAEALPTMELLLGLPARPAPLAGAPRLRWVHSTSAGVEHVLPLDWLPRGAALTTNSGVHGPKTQEYVTMALLMLNARLPMLIGQQHQALWRQAFTPSIAGKRLLVVGLGQMGAAAARAGRALGLEVTGIRQRPGSSGLVARCLGVEALDEELGRADFVVLSMPLTAATRGLVDRRRLGLMKPGAGLVNIARGAVLDNRALTDLLAAGTIGGAVLDVFPAEPLPADHFLWHTPNLVITPHVSSDDAASYVPRTLDLFFENLGRLRAGEKLRNLVDPARGY